MHKDLLGVPPEIIEDQNINEEEKGKENKINNEEKKDVQFDYFNFADIDINNENNNQIKYENKNGNNNNGEFGDDKDCAELYQQDYDNHIKQTINLIIQGLREHSTTLDDLVSGIIIKKKVGKKSLECFNIQDFNRALQGIGVELNEIRLSCLCNQYSIPGKLNIIDKNKLKNDVEQK